MTAAESGADQLSSSFGPVTAPPSEMDDLNLAVYATKELAEDQASSDRDGPEALAVWLGYRLTSSPQELAHLPHLAELQLRIGQAAAGGADGQ